ncbi:MAG: leucyl aminopeptidase family protein, partial [Candidatus Marsarchaeota archaeon]|nr:leucyl aminopeptidase family protein [Candidatus Marsarchaeota archaeon]
MRIDIVPEPIGVIAEPLPKSRGEPDTAQAQAQDKFHYSVEKNKIIGPDADSLKWGAQLASYMESSGFAEVSVIPAHLNAEELSLGLMLADYRFTKSTSQAGTADGKVVHIVAGKGESLSRAGVVYDSVKLARDLGNEPAGNLPPEKFAETVKVSLSGLPVNVTVMSYAQLLEEGFGGIVGVGKGSANPPCLLVAHYSPHNPSRRVALVGKGVVFDAGGLNLKPTGAIDTMYTDKCGAAARLGLKVEVISLAPLVENVPSGSATRPGDILKMYDGKTVEVLNTDAEGRLILADAMSYAIKKYSPDELIDLATLTGAQVVALGTKMAAVMGNDRKLVAGLIESGERVHEHIWELPLPGFYDNLVKSRRADLKNVVGSQSREAGCIVGGLFLKHFAGSCAWAHIDLAGPSHTAEGWDWNPPGATGFGVRLLIDHLLKLDSGSGRL